MKKGSEYRLLMINNRNDRKGKMSRSGGQQDEIKKKRTLSDIQESELEQKNEEEPIQNPLPNDKQSSKRVKLGSFNQIAKSSSRHNQSKASENALIRLKKPKDGESKSILASSRFRQKKNTKQVEFKRNARDVYGSYF